MNNQAVHTTKEGSIKILLLTLTHTKRQPQTSNHHRTINLQMLPTIRTKALIKIKECRKLGSSKISQRNIRFSINSPNIIKESRNTKTLINRLSSQQLNKTKNRGMDNRNLNFLRQILTPFTTRR